MLELQTQSAYSEIRIRRQGETRSLLFVRDNGREVVESRVHLDRPHEPAMPYVPVMFAGYLFKPQQEQVLIVGLGGGSMVHFLKYHEPTLRIDVVEIDPVIVQLADEYFDVRSDDNVGIVTIDAFDYLADTPERYDVIYMDAYLEPSQATDSTGMPRRLKTVAFYTAIQTKLRPSGLVVVNLNEHDATPEDISTIRAAFAQLALFDVPRSRNVVAVASTAASPVSESMLEERARHLDERFQASFSFAEMLEDRR